MMMMMRVSDYRAINRVDNPESFCGLTPQHRIVRGSGARCHVLLSEELMRRKGSGYGVTDYFLSL
jgi:hypothetical protein